MKFKSFQEVITSNETIFSTQQISPTRLAKKGQVPTKNSSNKHNQQQLVNDAASHLKMQHRNSGIIEVFLQKYVAPNTYPPLM